MKDKVQEQQMGEVVSNTPKTCFVIMPISNHPDYDNDHFTRVYNYLIKPACESAGYKPVRADDSIKTDHITITILQQIIGADIAICDMSSRNANVFYELGMRQAFNKKTVLIRDASTAIPFDIQDLRTLEYDKNLRVDNIKKSIDEISKAIKETENMTDEEINSMIQLLGIKSAKVEKSHEMSTDTSLIMNEIKSLANAVKDVKQEVKSRTNNFIITSHDSSLGELDLKSFNYIDCADSPVVRLGKKRNIGDISL